MPSFFSTLSDIDQHASFVKRRYSLSCEYCKKIGHLIAHGNVYKQVSMSVRDVVGKRVVCCKRFGHAGCGRTVQMRLSCQLPRRVYSGFTVGRFILCLLASVSVVNAYTQATGQASSRHAWRWLTALKLNIWRYRSRLKRVALSGIESILFDTLFRCARSSDNVDAGKLCLDFQYSHQMAFI
ncbi:MAG TPA: hypothetical protein DDW91_08990 [Shewanella frigidimarina]|nr:hypothetical protein [Shewanella frigidimarina]